MNRIICLFLAFCFTIPSIYAQRALTDEQWRNDLDFAREKVLSMHPNWYAGQPEGQFSEDINKLKNSLSKLSDLQIALELQAILAKGRDAQTRLDLTPALQREPVIPVGFGWYADGLYVSGGVSAFKDAMGKRVLDINGTPPSEVLRMVGRFVAHENDYTHTRDALALLRFPNILKYTGISSDDTLHLQLDNPGALSLSADLYPLDVRSMRGGMTPVNIQREKKDLRWQPTTTFYEIFWLEDSKTVYFQMNRSFSREMALARGEQELADQLPPFKAYADSLLSLLRQNEDAKLLIDLRFNSDGYASDAISLLDSLKTLPVGKKKEHLFIATNAYTQNGALETALYYKQNSRAVILGEPSGQIPNYFHEKKMVVLPNAQLPLYISTKQYRNDQVKGNILQPMVLIPLQFEDFQEGKDPVLDYVREQ